MTYPLPIRRPEKPCAYCGKPTREVYSYHPAKPAEALCNLGCGMLFFVEKAKQA